MVLSQEKNADLIVMDDNAAKKTAKYLGFAVTGTLGVLLKAKEEGFIEEISPLTLEEDNRELSNSRNTTQDSFFR